MTFTTPCFVRVENPEKRKELIEWLERIGYHVCSCCLFDGWNTLHCRGIDRLKIAYEVHGICDYDEETRYSIDQFKAENADSKYPAVDCGENIELFKALAAMMDGPECTEQYLMATANLYVLKRGKIKQLAAKGELLHSDVIVKCGGVFSSLRKATVEEIVEYFKNNEL